jgi:hypothetical protein
VPPGTIATASIPSRAGATCIGKAYKDYPAECAFRDVRTATLMPPTVDRMLETIGKAALGIQEGMFRTGAGPQGS